MPSSSLIEIADRKSRQRAMLFALAAVIFLFVEILTHPAFDNAAYAHGWRAYAWAFNALLLLLCLGGGGGILNSTQIRALIQDDVAISNNRAACTLGFWVAMITGLVLYCLPAFQWFSGRQVCFVVVTLATTSAMLRFSWLEYRAHADA